MLMLMDISSEVIHSLLPMFMFRTLGASVLMVGLVEGLAEATALIVKMTKMESCECPGQGSRSANLAGLTKGSRREGSTRQPSE